MKSPFSFSHLHTPAVAVRCQCYNTYSHKEQVNNPVSQHQHQQTLTPQLSSSLIFSFNMDGAAWYLVEVKKPWLVLKSCQLMSNRAKRL